MIVIFSTENDHSTHQVVKWLYFYQANFVLVNNINKIINIEINVNNLNSDFSFTLENGVIVSKKEISIVWLRKGSHFFKSEIFSKSVIKKWDLLVDHLRDEIKAIENYLFHQLMTITIGSYFTSQPNKILLLEVARQCGFKIPNTYITKQSFNCINTKRYISKNIQDVFTMIFKGDIYFNRTFLNQNSNQSVLLFPSLFQEYIAKQFEIRVFYFDGLIFATAILSAQETKSEMIDYRSFDGKNEAIKVPYRLANNLKNMVLKLTKRLGYRTCSIDFILSKDGEAYFLEVNPVGQFGMVSTICNYQIEKKIAIKLINYEKK